MDVIYDMAQEWASIPVPHGYKTQTGKISKGQSTFYDVNKGNKAKKGGYEKIRNALLNFRKDSNVQMNTQGDLIRNSKSISNQNPYKEQVNSSTSNSKNVTVYQTHKTEMTINGAANPVLTAQMVQRHNENTMIHMAHNTKSLIT